MRIFLKEKDSTLIDLSQEKGKGSRVRIAKHVFSIWERCLSSQEAYYSSLSSFLHFLLALFLLRNGSLGFGDKMICKALSNYYLRSATSLVSTAQKVYHYNPQLAPFISFLASLSPLSLTDQSLLSSYPISLGTFCSVALCSPISSFDDARSLIASEPYYAEPKYDGVRIQVHRAAEQLYVFGRSGEVHSLLCFLSSVLSR